MEWMEEGERNTTIKIKQTRQIKWNKHDRTRHRKKTPALGSFLACFSCFPAILNVLTVQESMHKDPNKKEAS